MQARKLGVVDMPGMNWVSDGEPGSRNHSSSSILGGLVDKEYSRMVKFIVVFN